MVSTLPTLMLNAQLDRFLGTLFKSPRFRVAISGVPQVVWLPHKSGIHHLPVHFFYFGQSFIPTSKVQPSREESTFVSLASPKYPTILFRSARSHTSQARINSDGCGSKLVVWVPWVAETVVMGSTSADARAPLHDYRLSRDQNQRFITGLAHPVLQPPGTNHNQSNPSSSGVGESCSAASTVAGAELPSATIDTAPSTVHRRIPPLESNTKAPPSCLSARLTTLPSSTTTKVPGSLLFDERNSSCLLYTSPSPRDLSTSRMPSSA